MQSDVRESIVISDPNRTSLEESEWRSRVAKDTGRNSSVNQTNNNGTWILGLDTTKILIIFLIIVFLVLIFFLLLYHFIIKKMRQKSISKIAHKSASGSIADEKARNIFAHPERHLAVDQSTRNLTNSPASTNDNNDQQSLVVVGGAGGSQAVPSPAPVANQAAPTTSSTATAEPNKDQSSKGKDKNLDSKKSGSLGRSKPVQVHQHAPHQTQHAAQHPAPQESSVSNRSQRNHGSLTGALAGIRDTLKDTGAK